MPDGDARDPSVRRRWANLRFSIIGPLLAAPPEHGELQAKLSELANSASAIRSSVRNIERPAESLTNGSTGAALVHDAGIRLNSSPSL